MRRIVALVALLAVACASEKPVARKVVAPKPPPVAREPEPQPEPPPPPPEPPRVLSEADAKALVDTWLKAQNDGDFHVYQTLYAQDFKGIKRVGKRTEPFDRVGWMADRGWMFEPPDHGKPMHVEIKDVEAEVTQSSAKIRFVQAFSRGNFADKGPKELELVIEGREVRIGREEMLSSQVLKSARRRKGKTRPKGDNSWTFVGAGGEAAGGWGPPSEDVRPKRESDGASSGAGEQALPESTAVPSEAPANQ
jgi:hypothetical protein